MKVISWNVNSIRSRHQRLIGLLERHQPDVVAIQETKCTDETFADLVFDYSSLGYEVAHHGIDHWNGVALLSRVGLDDIGRGFVGTNREPFDEARLIAATCAGVRFYCLYVPNGRELDNPHYLFKLVWLERLRGVANASVESRLPTVLLGDFNVAPTDIDIYDPKRFRRKTHASPPERSAIQAILDCGLVDVTRQHHREEDIYTFWNYRPGMFEQNRGLRIDLALTTPDIAERTTDVWIDLDERDPNNTAFGIRPDPSDAPEKTSDHAPIVIEIDWPKI